MPNSWKASQQRPSGGGGNQGQEAPGPGSLVSWVSLPKAGPGLPGEGAVRKERVPPGTPSRTRSGTVHLQHLHMTSSSAEPPRSQDQVSRQVLGVGEWSMAGEVGAGASPLGAQTPQAPWGPQARGDGPLSSGGGAYGPRHPVADHNKGRVIGPRGRSAVLAHFTGALEFGDFFLGGPQCAYQGACVPDPGLGLSCPEEASKERPDQKRRREYSPPLNGPRVGGPQELQQWTRVVGVMGSQVMVRGDNVYVSSNPGPVSV